MKALLIGKQTKSITIKSNLVKLLIMKPKLNKIIITYGFYLLKKKILFRTDLYYLHLF